MFCACTLEWGSLWPMSAQKKWQAAAYFILSGGFLASAIATLKDASTTAAAAGAQDVKGLGRLGRRAVRNAAGQKALPDGKIGAPVGRLHDVKTIDERVALIKKLIKKGSMNNVLRERTVELLSQKCNSSNQIFSADVTGPGLRWCVPEKDCWAEVCWLFNSVRKPASKYAVRYTRDMILADTFTAAERTLLKTHGGDCFVQGTKVLRREGHALVPIESLREGDEVWGYDRWSRVTRVWGDKGVLRTWLIRLNNGSTMRLTPDHKVWIADRIISRDENGGHKPDSERITNLRRVTVRDLKPGQVVIQPDAVDFGTGAQDPRRALIEGYYLADGWSEERRFSIAGKDGCAKEAQKREVEELCRELGIKTHWHRRSITIKDPEWTARMASMGGHAPEKRALSIDLDQPAASALLRGVFADSGLNSCGKTRTFTTTSRELALQTRVLLKQHGITCSERYITDHGGLGTHPIHRLQTRVPWQDRPADMKAAKLLAVTEVIRDDVALPCWDIETDDHFVWLPEADWTTSQCDDYVVLLGSMLMAVGHPIKIRVIQTKDKASWSHVYLVTPEEFDDPKARWRAVDCSVDKPCGWEAPGAEEVAKTGRPAGITARVKDFPMPTEEE